MITLIYLLLNGYPSDKLVIPGTIVLVVLAMYLSIKGIKEDITK